MADTTKKDAKVSEDLAAKFKSEKETPYTRWVKAEGLDIIPSFYVQNLKRVDLKPWARPIPPYSSGQSSIRTPPTFSRASIISSQSTRPSRST